jgi:hypothetical protein
MDGNGQRRTENRIAPRESVAHVGARCRVPVRIRERNARRPEDSHRDYGRDRDGLRQRTRITHQHHTGSVWEPPPTGSRRPGSGVEADDNGDRGRVILGWRADTEVRPCIRTENCGDGEPMLRELDSMSSGNTDFPPGILLLGSLGPYD